MYWWRFAVVHYLAEALGSKVADVDAFDGGLDRQRKRPWNIHIKRFSSKWHFLRCVARYLRRFPIAEDRFISVTDEQVEYWANDLRLKAWVRIKVSVEEFLELQIQHVPDRYAHNIRYFGLASPAGKQSVFQCLICSSRRGTKVAAQAPFVRGNERKVLQFQSSSRLRWRSSIGYSTS